MFRKNINILINRYSLFIYLISLSLLGSVFLCLPVSSVKEPLKIIDSLFISTSAVCVTGLSTVEISKISPFGKFIIITLVQFGGLGIVTFASIYLSLISNNGMSLTHTKMIKEYFLTSVEYDPKKITINIILITFLIEFIGAIFLLPVFLADKMPFSKAVLYSFFHSISSFCNAGFSLYDDSVYKFHDNSYFLTVLSFIYIFGGLGFVIYSDIYKKIKNKRHKLRLHTKLTIYVSAFLLVLGTISYYFLEMHHAFLNFDNKLINAFFQSATTRTAGFAVVNQSKLREPSFFLTIFLMFIGGGSGSIAGGLKVTTFFVVFVVFIKGFSSLQNISLSNRRSVSKEIVAKAFVLFIRGITILCISSFLLSITEVGKDFTFEDMLFEIMSSLSTVGLTRGITSNLSQSGKLVVIITMFAGRIGLSSIVLPFQSKKKNSYYYPQEEILL